MINISVFQNVGPVANVNSCEWLVDAVMDEACDPLSLQLDSRLAVLEVEWFTIYLFLCDDVLCLGGCAHGQLQVFAVDFIDPSLVRSLVTPHHPLNEWVINLPGDSGYSAGLDNVAMICRMFRCGFFVLPMGNDGLNACPFPLKVRTGPHSKA